MLAQGIYKPFSSPQWQFFARASMEDYGLSYEIAGFGPFETLCCISHTQNGLFPYGSLVIKQRLQQ